MRTQNAEPRSRLAAIALHDVSPATWPMCERLLALIHSCGADIPVTLLIVPQMHRRASIDGAAPWRGFIDHLLSHGAEIAMHGVWHLDEGGRSPTLRAAVARRVLTAGEAEFAAMDSAAARQRIEMGLVLLRRCGWLPAGFVPPAWQISTEAAAVLAEFPFEYTTSSQSITHLPSARHWSVPCLGLSARTALRRELSIRVTRWRARQLSDTCAMRIALHPLDAYYRSTLEMWRCLLQAALRERQPVTKSELLRRLSARRL